MNKERIGTGIMCIAPMFLLWGIQLLTARGYILFKKLIYIFSTKNATPEDIALFEGSVPNEPGFSMNVLLIYIFISLAVEIIIYFIWMKRPVDTIKNMTVISFFAIPLMFFALEIVISVDMGIISAIFPWMLNGYEELIDNMGVNDFSTVSTIVTIVGAPIVEELAFRGIIMTNLNKLIKKFYIVNIIQAFLFGFMHLNLFQSTYAFLAALFLGYIAYRYKSVYASIIAHAAFNFTGTYFVTWLAKEDASLPMRMLGSFNVSVLILGLVYILFRYEDKKRNG